MGVKPFPLAGFETKLQNANSIILESNCKFWAFLRIARLRSYDEGAGRKSCESDHDEG